MKKEELIKEYKLTEDQYYGKVEIVGTLDLNGLTNIPKGFNPIVGGSLDLRGLTSIPEDFNPIVGGDLWLDSLTSIPEGFNPIVGGSLVLIRLTSIPEDFNPIVGGGLYLRGLTSIPKGFNPIVGGNLYLCNLTSIPIGFNTTVGGDLYLSNLTSIPEGFNPIVGGRLDLRSLTSIPEGFNPTVCGYLDLSRLTSIPEGFNPIVGGTLWLNSLTSNYTRLNGKPLEWLDGKYISVDGIFTEVIARKGNIIKVKKLNKDKEFYLVTDGNGKYSHGDTLQKAKDDLIYKINSSIDKDIYRNYTIDTELTFDKAIECYRVITGACSFGTKDFVTTNNIENKTYSIKEIIGLTKGKYGNEIFNSFFNK